MNPTAEYDGEPIRGLPARLPEGETILWQGSPRWQTFMRRAFHTNKIMAYFAILMAWRFGADLYDGMGFVAAVLHSAELLIPAGLCVGVLALIAWGMVKSTMYTITTKRVVMRFGVAFEKSFNLPFSQIEAANVKRVAGGYGDIPLTLTEPNKISYILLWPHARPWFINNPQPMIRSIPDVDTVAGVLANALKSAAEARLAEDKTENVAVEKGNRADTGTPERRPASAPHGLGLSPQPAAAAE